MEIVDNLMKRKYSKSKGVLLNKEEVCNIRFSRNKLKYIQGAIAEGDSYTFTKNETGYLKDIVVKKLHNKLWFDLDGKHYESG